MGRIAVLVSVLLFVTVVAVLLFVGPPKQCPNWRSTSMWLPVMWTALLLAGLVFVVVRWNWLIEKAIGSIDYPVTMPVPFTLIMTVLMGCGMSQVPLLLLLNKLWLTS